MLAGNRVRSIRSLTSYFSSSLTYSFPSSSSIKSINPSFSIFPKRYLSSKSSPNPKKIYNDNNIRKNVFVNTNALTSTIFTNNSKFEEVITFTLNDKWKNYSNKVSDEIKYISYREALNNIFKELSENKEYLEDIRKHYVDKNSYTNLLNKFRRRFIMRPQDAFSTQDDGFRLINAIIKEFKITGETTTVATQPSSAFLSDFFDMIKPTLLESCENIITTNSLLQSFTDIRSPKDWYPLARTFKRKIYYHGGPTNSGKTHFAIERLKQADISKGGGIFCGPLRLLALEIYDRLNKSGVYCSLSTGQEKRIVPGATHISCTIEMLSTEKIYDIAVIDEIQMIGDTFRGQSWTKAVLGLAANEIHLCGGLESAELVQKMCEDIGDDFELVKYERLSPLEVEQESLNGDYTKIQKGDCIVAFSSASLFSIKHDIEKNTKFKCAIIFGSLPSETRSQQANLFNDPNSGYDVLIASDAIGMGLNLNIRRVILHSVVKFNGVSMDFIPPTQLKQIAGRAGRHSSEWNVGKVTTWQKLDLPYLKAVMSYDVPKLDQGIVCPTVNMFRAFSEKYRELNGIVEEYPQLDPSIEKYFNFNRIAEHKISLARILTHFSEFSKMDDNLRLSDLNTMIQTSNWLQSIPLSLEERFLYSSAPINRSSLCYNAIYRYAAHYAAGVHVKLGISLPLVPPHDFRTFLDWVNTHAILELYLWLSSHFHSQFVEVPLCVDLISKSLETINKFVEASASNYNILERKMSKDLVQSENIRKELLANHVISYLMSMLKIIKSHKDYLPPIEFCKEIKETTIKYIEEIEKEKLNFTEKDLNLIINLAKYGQKDMISLINKLNKLNFLREPIVIPKDENNEVYYEDVKEGRKSRGGKRGKHNEENDNDIDKLIDDIDETSQEFDINETLKNFQSQF